MAIKVENFKTNFQATFGRPGMRRDEMRVFTNFISHTNPSNGKL
jgi:hypothetical protein